MRILSRLRCKIALAVKFQTNTLPRCARAASRLRHVDHQKTSNFRGITAQTSNFVF